MADHLARFMSPAYLGNRRAPAPGPSGAIRLFCLVIAVPVIAWFAIPADSLRAQPAERKIDVVPSGSVPIAGDYWALLIGIDRYQNVPPLETAVRDVLGVRQALIERYGFQPDRMIQLTDAQATRTNIEQELYRLGQLAKADDSVLIYYAGHGQYDSDGRLGWWVPVEGQPKSPGTFITNASIRDYIEGMKARHVYLVADSCFSGTLFGKSRAMPPVNDQFYARLYAKRSRWGLTSGGMEPVADGGRDGHSIFAYHFISLLKENGDPYLVPSHIFDRIAPVIANNAEQTPRSEPLKGAGDEGGQFLFRLAVATSGAPASPTAKRPSAALSQAEQELKALEEQERETDDREKIAALQQQIEEKKKKIEEKKRKKIEEARVRPSDHARPRGDQLAAIRVEPLEPQPPGQPPQAKRAIGVLVTAVEPETVAALAGIQRGDIIQEVNREVIRSLEDYQRAAAKVPDGTVVLLLVKREGAYRFIPLNPR